LKNIKALSPYIYPNQLNFKDKAFNAWRKQFSNAVVEGWYPKLLHGVLFRRDLFPTFCHFGDARLIFVQPFSLYFDASISVLTHEVVPFIWDCWPCFYNMMEKWLIRHNVKTAIFTSRQEMEAMKQRCPHIDMIWCPEGIDTSRYTAGKPLTERTIDLLEFGRSNEKIIPAGAFEGIRHIATKVGDSFIYNDKQLYEAMGDAKVTICLPRSITHPEEAGGIETLTQRYWECMLSRIVMVGHAPKELVDLIGYNPCVEISSDSSDVKRQISDIIEHIEDYQVLVDKNRVVALQYGDWKNRMCQVMDFLESKGYKCS
jgi:hypothetical protein